MRFECRAEVLLMWKFELSSFWLKLVFDDIIEVEVGVIKNMLFDGTMMHIAHENFDIGDCEMNYLDEIIELALLQMYNFYFKK